MSVDLSHVLDNRPWGGYQKWLVLLAALTIVFDGIDNQLLGIVIPTLMKEWSVARAAFAPVVSLGYLGMMVGGAVAGLAGDRIGRKVALLASMVVFGVMTVGATLAGSVTALGVMRLLAGVGLGGAMPNAAALVAEYVPVSRRAFAVTLTIVCVPLGATVAGLLAIQLLPFAGWRGLFVVGGFVPVAAVIVLARLLPESPRYLARHPARWGELARFLQRTGHAVAEGETYAETTGAVTKRAPASALFQPPFRRDTFALWGAFFSCLLAVYLGFSWVPSMLTGAGFSPDIASKGITGFNLGGVAGAVLGGLAIMRFGSRISMLVMTAAAVVSAAVMSTMHIATTADTFAILAMLTITGGLINGVQTTMYALAAHVYPTSFRATGVGTAVAVGRLGAVLSGYAGAWALEYRGSTSFFVVVASAMTVCLISLASVRRHVERG